MHVLVLTIERSYYVHGTNTITSTYYFSCSMHLRPISSTFSDDYPLVLLLFCFNRLTPKDPYMGRTATLTSKRCILCIYSTNIVTEYFKHALYSPFFSLQNAICFIMLTCLVPVLFTFYLQDVLKLKKKIIIIPAP